MFRILNIVAVLVLVGSAVYAYEIKYATLYQAEQLAKAKRDLARETDRIAMLKAEWAHLSSPERIETLAGKLLGGQSLALTQIVAAAAVPEKPARGDEIGAKLSDLGLAAPTHTPSHGGAAATPARPAAGVAKPGASPAKSDKPGASLAKSDKPGASPAKPDKSGAGPAKPAASPAKPAEHAGAKKTVKAER